MEEKTVQPIAAQPGQQVVISVQPAPTEAPAKTDAPVEETKSEEKAPDNLVPQDHYLTSPLFYEIANYFGVESPEYEAAKEKLSTVTDYVINKLNSNKVEDILVELRKLEEVVQPPAWGEKRYTNVYKYIRLAAQRDSFNKALSALERTK